MNNKSKNIDPVEVIGKKLNHEASEEELIYLEKWRRSNPNNQRVFNEYARLWEKLELARLEQDIDVEAEWKKLLESLPEENQKRFILKAQPMRWMARAAALLIILASVSLGSFYIFQRLQSVKVYTDLETKELILPDNSTVTLNVNSVLMYSKRFSQRSRGVKLEGEAYFEVEPNGSQPFIVRSGDLDIRVVGTSFNVDANHPEAGIEVVVNSGKVILAARENQASELILEKGEKGKYSAKDNLILKSENLDQNFISWKTKNFRFVDEPLSGIVSYLEKAFYKKIEITNPLLNECPVTAEFKDLDLDAIINVLREILNLQIDTENERILISGPGC